MTRALDTNIFVRLLTNDDARQARLANALVEEDFLITPTVLLETEWVLKSSYGWSRAARVEALMLLLDLPHALATPNNARWAIDRLKDGADFADMMHLTTAEGASAFATFERRLGAQAGAETPLPIERIG